MFWTIFICCSCFKLLLIPSYRSTDFEVHRNWLAITHSLPLSKWYFESTSEWTLDYPPFFAYFEYILSNVAKLFDPEMLKVENLNYASELTIIFQRLSVIVSDVVYAWGVKSSTDSLKHNEGNILIALLLGNIGLFFVDHIHFQYNGILFGILLLSISKIRKEQYLQSALLFSILLNMKHIFIYIAPAFVVYLLKFYCLNSKKPIQNLAKLATVVGSVTLLSFGPFYDHIPQVLSRLFPFKRGLCHAYWAPNFWALYNVFDKALGIILKIETKSGLNTGGLVQEFDHQVLPSVKPFVTFILTGLAMLPALGKLFSVKYNNLSTPQNFIRCITICACTSFMFGWHVHEKAILMVLIPLSLLSTQHKTEANGTLFLSIVASYSLLPLLHKQELLEIKLCFFFFYISFLFIAFNYIFKTSLLKLYELLYLCGFSIVFLYEHVLQYVLKFDNRLPFLPLLLISFYCSLGVTYFWLKYYVQFLCMRNVERVKGKGKEIEKEKENVFGKIKERPVSKKEKNFASKKDKKIKSK